MCPQDMFTNSNKKIKGLSQLTNPYVVLPIVLIVTTVLVMLGYQNPTRTHSKQPKINCCYTVKFNDVPLGLIPKALNSVDVILLIHKQL